MLIHPHDQADDELWRQVLADVGFGQLVTAATGDEGLPVIVPTHYRFDGVDVVETHVHVRNPVLDVLRRSPRAVLAVIHAWAYVPTDWNAPPRPVHQGVPTSYYAAVQVAGDVELVEAPDPLAALLARQVDRFQPEGGHDPVDAEGAYAPLLGAIVGLRLRVTSVRAKAKFGGNKVPEVRRDIADRLAERAGPGDAEARRLLQRTLADADDGG